MIGSRPEATPNRAVQPETRDTDFYLADRSLRQLLGLYAPAQQREHMEAQLHRLGTLIGDRLDDLAHASDRQPPVLHHRDRQGRGRQSILKHPDYREMERLAFGEFELAAMSPRPAFGWTEPLHPALSSAASDSDPELLSALVDGIPIPVEVAQAICMSS